jgi:hypothetical protein
MSKLARALALAAMLAAMGLAGMTAVAQAHPTGPVIRQDARRPPTDPQVEKAWPQRLAAARQQAQGEATVRRQLARERFSIPNRTPAQATGPIRPTPHRGQAGQLAPALAVLAVVLALAAGIAVPAARRAHRLRRAGQPA